MRQEKAVWLSADLFWSQFVAFRIAYITGRYGSGKSALAFLMAARLLAEGRVGSVVANIPCTFGGRVPEGETIKKAAIVLDESWIYIDSSSDVKDYAAFARKQEMYLILPSVFPIHARLSFFWVQMIFNAYIVGLPAWVFRWELKQKSVRQSGYFAIWRPTAIFGHYDTLTVAGDDGGISDAIALTSKQDGFKGTRKQQQIEKRAAVYLGALDDAQAGDGQAALDAAETLESVAEEIGIATEDIEVALHRAQGRRR